MIDREAKGAFWKVVEDCLVEIHRLSRTDAHKRCSDLRKRIESPADDLSSDLFYHNEPIDVASRLKGSQLPLAQVLRHHW
jgi:hypothetical protein